MKLRNLLLNFLLFFTFSFTTFASIAQTSISNEPVHEVIIKTRAFSTLELDEIIVKLAAEGSFSVQIFCKNEGILVVKVPVAASLRINTIEEIAINTTKNVLHSEAEVTHNQTLKSVTDCNN